MEELTRFMHAKYLQQSLLQHKVSLSASCYYYLGFFYRVWDFCLFADMKPGWFSPEVRSSVRSWVLTMACLHSRHLQVSHPKSFGGACFALICASISFSFSPHAFTEEGGHAESRISNQS